jgi:hypothetical protein
LACFSGSSIFVVTRNDAILSIGVLFVTRTIPVSKTSKTKLHYTASEHEVLFFSSLRMRVMWERRVHLLCGKVGM